MDMPEAILRQGLLSSLAPPTDIRKRQQLLSITTRGHQTQVGLKSLCGQVPWGFSCGLEGEKPDSPFKESHLLVARTDSTLTSTIPTGDKEKLNTSYCDLNFNFTSSAQIHFLKH